MKLQDEIHGLLQKVAANIPAETAEVMAGALRQLKESAVGNSACRRGGQAPVFELPDVRGEMVSSPALLAQGPLVISFYRGVW